MKHEPDTDNPLDSPTPLTEAALDAAFLAELDPSVLGEALREPGQESAGKSLHALEQKIITLTDPQTLSLLDEALAPEADNDERCERILAATLAGPPANATADNPPAIIGRIAPTPWRYAAAAVITLAACLGLWFATTTPPTRTTPITENKTTDIDATDTDVDNADSLDQTIALVDEAAALFGAFSETIESDLQTLSDSLEDDAIGQDTIWSDMDAYEQFLADIDSDLG